MNALLTAEQVAARLQIHVVNARTMLKRGELGKAYRLGRCWRVDERELEAALERFRVDPLPARAARENSLVPKKEFLDLLRPRTKRGGA
ncbi:MAG: hypothetical protein FD180_4342 [Planctomycetota bacterium]|nr:MAG: hypothetical protein FD180_4342 [Planctomycetota bacterium]